MNLQLLNNSNHLVKCHCLSLLGGLRSLNNLQGENVKLICKFTKSQDPRVRTAAYDALVRISYLYSFFLSLFSSMTPLLYTSIYIGLIIIYIAPIA
jgi:vesicle coat complex subunit